MKKTFKRSVLIAILALNLSPILAQSSTQTAAKKWINQTDFGLLVSDNDNNYIVYPQAVPSTIIDPNRSYTVPYYYGTTQTDPVFTVYHFIGRNIKPWLVTGAGAGLDFFSIKAIPVGVGLRTYLKPSRKISPSFSLDAGYAFRGEKIDLPENSFSDYNLKITGGAFFNPSIGLRINIGKEEAASAFTIAMGYRQQSSNETVEIPSNSYKFYQKTSYQRLSIKLGFVF
jgi:hypothetical protein